jgi:hypothetical protein
MSYVLPLRHGGSEDLAELTTYLRTVASIVDEILVVDGSEPSIFAIHHDAWADVVTHVPPDPDLRFANGKVNGVSTGVRRARHEAVVVADDDVRYRRQELDRFRELLVEADVVRPTNYFDPMPWHARWDSARTLLNRSISQDWPGTLGIRASAFRSWGGYDGDVLFENLQRLRTAAAAGARIVSPDLYVRRLPPSARRFWSQRVRQAYDDFAIPARMVAMLCIAPAAFLARHRRRWILAAAAGSIALAELGRRRDGGSRVFPPSTSWFAPLWLAERAVCSWAAVGCRVLLGGCPYAGGIIGSAATRPEPVPIANEARRTPLVPGAS